MNADETRAHLRQWVLDNSKQPELSDVQDDTEILERRLITSLQIMDLILYLEHLLGRPVDVSRIQPGAFATVHAIYETFFHPAGEPC